MGRSVQQKRVLCFNPYVRWTLHSARQNTILHGLHLRNAQTLMVLCDALMLECDLYQPSKGAKAQRKANSCNRCQAESAFLTAKANVSYLWLGRWIEPDTIAKAQAWAADIENPETACYNGWPIGEWVRSSVHSHFRTDALDIDDPNIRAVYQRYAAGGAAIATGLDALYRHEKPDAQLLFNGRMAPTRIALELAKLHGIRTITEERGQAPGYMRLVKNTHCLDPQPFFALYEKWKDTPLNKQEIGELQNLLENHLSGFGHEIGKFVAPTAGPGTIRETLKIDETKRLAVLFTSSTDEPQGQPEAAGVFDHQHQWIKASIEKFRSEPNWHLVIRTHPNSGGKRAVGTNRKELEFIDELQKNLPNNVSIVKPEDDLSSFDLIQAAHCGLIWHSSIGVEMAALGRPVLRVGNYWFHDTDCMRSIEDPAEYESAVSSLLKDSEEDLSMERTISAWRLAYCWFFRQSVAFPLVQQPDWAAGEAAYQSTEDLRPGEDAGLDRVCSIIIEDESIHTPPHDRPISDASAERAAISAFTKRYAAL